MTSKMEDKFVKDMQSELIPSDLLQTVLSWIGINMDPEDVFEQKVLEQWAESNDYVKE